MTGWQYNQEKDYKNAILNFEKALEVTHELDGNNENKSRYSLQLGIFIHSQRRLYQCIKVIQDFQKVKKTLVIRMV